MGSSAPCPPCTDSTRTALAASRSCVRCKPPDRRPRRSGSSGQRLEPFPEQRRPQPVAQLIALLRREPLGLFRRAQSAPVFEVALDELVQPSQVERLTMDHETRAATDSLIAPR